MSLELISKIGNKLQNDIVSELIERICRTQYKNVYFFDEFSSYGFVHAADDYTDGVPPLFDLVITESLICLAVHGDLNDLENAKNVITSTFLEMGISLNFHEEGHENRNN